MDKKQKKTTTDPINKKDSKCFQYVVALNHEEIIRDLQTIIKIKSFVDKYNWEGINYPSGKDDWKKIGKNNLTIALNISYVKKRKNISCLYFIQNITQIVKNKSIF